MEFPYTKTPFEGLPMRELQTKILDKVFGLWLISRITIYNTNLQLTIQEN